MSDYLADSGQWIYDSVMSYIKDEIMAVQTTRTVQIIGYCSEEKFFEFSDKSTSIYGILKADSCKELTLPSTKSDIVGLILSLYDFYYTITPMVNLLSKRSVNSTSLESYENTIIIVINKCRVVSNGLASPIMNSRSILDYSDVKSLIASKPFGPLGKKFSQNCSSDLNNNSFSEEENNLNNNMNISPKLKEAIAADLILFDEDELETQQQTNNSNNNNNNNINTNDSNGISILYTKENSILSNTNNEECTYVNPKVPLKEVSELDEIIMNRITDLQFKQSFISNKDENTHNKSITPSPAVLNDVQLGIQQHDVNLIYNNNKSNGSSSSTSSESDSDSINKNNNVNNNNNNNNHTKKRKHSKTKVDNNDIRYIDCSSNSDSEDENRIVKKKSKIGNYKYHVVNIDDIPNVQHTSLGRKVFPIQIDESTLQAIKVPPNAAAKSFLNKIKQLRNNT